MGIIVTVGVIAVVTLVAVHLALVAYFDHAAQAEEYRKVGSAKPEALMNLRDDEKQRLTSGPTPIDRAMQMLSKPNGRMTASPDIMPSASKDTAPLQCWSKMPCDVPPAMTAAPAEPPPPSPSASAAPPASAAPSSGALPPPGRGPIPAPPAPGPTPRNHP
jgi:hypothetical protein